MKKLPPLFLMISASSKLGLISLETPSEAEK